MSRALKLDATGGIALSEHHVKQAVTDLLEAEGWLVVRVQVGTFRSMDGKRMIRMGKRGFPDLMAVASVMHTPVPPNIAKYCRVLFVETKRPKGGKLSAEQEHWRDELLGRGHEWVLVGRVEDLRRHLHGR